MFGPESYIESYQNTKRALVNYLVKDEVLNKSFHSYIDAQTTFAKTLVKNTIDINLYAYDNIIAPFFPKDGKMTKAKVTVVDKNTTA